MTADGQAESSTDRKQGTPGKLSRWFQRKMNARMVRKIRGGKDHMMGMDMLILHTAGKQSGLARETPVAWFADGRDAWLVVASGGGGQSPDWHANLMANPDRAAVELPGRDPLPVTPRVLADPGREDAWRRITTAQPRYAKYQSKSDRVYPVVRLTPR
ncbi:nitroreductase family deazaflavin-dependent oxidoreductase [Streptomyces sp. 184]|uniref:nitroreductase family deazaflavin-dependent oxidoreductase n=1 Tax=Streptomyces sp. 184 TaxID=1827526 RepID=UPI0038920D19